jgi:hypothetical protein
VAVNVLATVLKNPTVFALITTLPDMVLKTKSPLSDVVICVVPSSMVLPDRYNEPNLIEGVPRSMVLFDVGTIVPDMDVIPVSDTLLTEIFALNPDDVIFVAAIYSFFYRLIMANSHV